MLTIRFQDFLSFISLFVRIGWWLSKIFTSFVRFDGTWDVKFIDHSNLSISWCFIQNLKLKGILMEIPVQNKHFWIKDSRPGHNFNTFRNFNAEISELIVLAWKLVPKYYPKRTFDSEGKDWGNKNYYFRWKVHHKCFNRHFGDRTVYSEIISRLHKPSEALGGDNPFKNIFHLKTSFKILSSDRTFRRADEWNVHFLI